MTSIGMTSHCMTSRYGVHFCIECVNRTVPLTCKVSIRYVSWFTRYPTTFTNFRMTLVRLAVSEEKSKISQPFGGPGGHLISNRPENTNLVGGVKILLPV